jgi:hypothetical protein
LDEEGRKMRKKGKNIGCGEEGNVEKKEGEEKNKEEENAGEREQ